VSSRTLLREEIFSRTVPKLRLTAGEQNSSYRQHLKKECTGLRAVFDGNKYGPSRKSSGIARNCNVLMRNPRKLGGWNCKVGHVR
jgi:hypothetical protein